MLNAGDFEENKTVELEFNTFDSNGGSVTVTDLLNSDVEIYKDQGLTQRSSDSGVSVVIDHDGDIGSHTVVIDLSDDADAGFYAAGSDYKVKLVGITVDGQTLNVWSGEFSIANRGSMWDIILSTSLHNIAQSSGKRLRQIASPVIRGETAQGPGTGNNQIQFDAGASATDGAYDPALICIVAGTGLGQCRLILQYDGGTKTATVDRDWKTNPDNASEFIIIGDAGREHVNEGLAQAGSSNTITLNALASAVDGTYVGQVVFIRSGTGQDQARVVTAYDGGTKVASIDGVNWEVDPDSTSGYVMLPAQQDKTGYSLSSSGNNAVRDVILDDATRFSGADIAAIEADTQNIQSRIPGALVSGKMDSDTTAISGSTEAADNLEASAETIVTAAAIAGTLSLTQMTTDLTEATDDHYNGRRLIWTSGVLQDQATAITDYDGTEKKLTFTGVTEAPSIGDTFNIV